MTIHVDPWFVYAFGALSLIPWVLRAYVWWGRRRLARKAKDQGFLVNASGEALDRFGENLFDTPRIVECDVAYRARLRAKLDEVAQ